MSLIQLQWLIRYQHNVGLGQGRGVRFLHGWDAYCSFGPLGGVCVSVYLCVWFCYLVLHFDISLKGRTIELFHPSSFILGSTIRLGYYQMTSD